MGKSISHQLESFFTLITDFIFARLPRQRPSRAALSRCKIISHRGEHDNCAILENTLPAFNKAAEAGVWGIEFDLRWTQDLQPVVFHDPDLARLFGDATRIARTQYVDLKKRFPLIPSLREVVETFGGKHHLMLEVKQEPYPDPVRQNRILADLFAPLTPQADYHILSLDPAMFDRIDFAPKSAFLPVAEANLYRLSRIALEKSYGGVNGHYLLMRKNRIRRHQQAGQKVGTGFIASPNSLYREIHRGVDYIYSNSAVWLQQFLS